MSVAVSFSPALLMMPRRGQLCVVDDHRLTGRRSCLGLIDTKREPPPLEGDAARNCSVGIPDLGVGPPGERRKNESDLVADGTPVRKSLLFACYEPYFSERRWR
jgi:hypothetical protein